MALLIPVYDERLSSAARTLAASRWMYGHVWQKKRSPLIFCGIARGREEFSRVGKVRGGRGWGKERERKGAMRRVLAIWLTSSCSMLPQCGQ
eukprot:scaffold13928_cov29-Tisochrysis_lutea.AAC.1